MRAGRVLILSSQPVLRNARVIKTASALVEAGFEVGIAADDAAEGQLNLLGGQSVPVTPAPRQRPDGPFKQGSRLHSAMNAVSFRGYKTRLRHVIDERQPDALHVMDPEALVPAMEYAGQIPVVYDAAEFFAGSEGAIESGAADYIADLYARVGGQIAAVTTVSTALAEAHARVHPALPRATVIENAAPCLATRPAYTGFLHRLASLPPLTKIALFHGGFLPGRGLAELAAGASALPEGWAMVFMGWGPMEGELRSVCGASVGRAVIVPAVPYGELMTYIAGASIGLIPYQPGPLNHELATPNKLYEYAAASVPIIASDLQELSARLAQWGNGWTVDASDLAGAVPALIANFSENDLATAGAAGRAFHEAINWRTEAAKLIAVYEAL